MAIISSLPEKQVREKMLYFMHILQPRKFRIFQKPSITHTFFAGVLRSFRLWPQNILTYVNFLIAFCIRQVL